MKKKVLFLSFFISILVLSISCEKEANMPWPDDVKNGVIATIKYPIGQYNGIFISDVDTLTIKFDIKIEMGDCSKLKLMAVLTQLDSTSDFRNQIEIAEYTASGNYSIGINEIVNAIPQYITVADIKFADKLTFFVNPVTADGTQLYGVLPFKDFQFGYDPNILASGAKYNFYEDFVFL